MDGTPEVLLITGPAGVGKSTVNWEVCKQLTAAGVAHAAIDLDELDRVYPAPADDPHKTALTCRHLALLWGSYAALGHRRLVISSIMVDLAVELAGIAAAIPGARMTVVRLEASEATLFARLNVREIGAGREAQIARSREQARQIAAGRTPDVLALPTDGRTPVDLAAAILAHVRWAD